MVTAIVMAGGFGSRLYPLSTPEFPKQFISIIDGESFFQKAIKRAKSVANRVIVTANTKHRDLVNSQLKESKNVKVIYEKKPLGTYKSLQKIIKSENSDEIYILLQADHYYRSEKIYLNIVKKTIKNYIPGKIFLHGINSNEYIEGLGYIYYSKFDKSLVGFIEKPSIEEYKVLKQNHQFLLHLGNTVFSGSTFLTECGLSKVNKLNTHSFDTAILNNSKNLIIKTLDAGWVDIGTWKNLIKIFPRDNNNNYASSGVNLINCNNCIAIEKYNTNAAILIKNQVNKLIILSNSVVIKTINITL